MTNRNMVSPDKARTTGNDRSHWQKELGNEAAPDSPQLSPQLDERRTRLQQPRSNDISSGNDPDKKRSG